MEFVTDNVSQFINFTKEEVLGESIYNIIHHGDHTRFSSALLPMVGWTSLDTNAPRSRTINCCRLLIKPSGNREETMEGKPQGECKYENMQVSEHFFINLSEKIVQQRGLLEVPSAGKIWS